MMDTRTDTRGDMRAIDLGCGPNKVPGSYGVDKYPHPGVDQAVDLDQAPWPLPSDAFDRVFARHVVEHVADITAFMREVHRIARDGGIVQIVTPHFSSLNSWQDPTHRWHLSSRWYATFTERYLSGHMPLFEHVSTDVEFPGGWRRGLIPRLVVRLKGLAWWEKHGAFVFRARNITTELRVRKTRPAA
jgi:SAM-dependent methyltransferase